MFKDNLYKVEELTDNGSAIQATVVLDKNHKIFAGHFPGQPILPGVCTLEIMKELIEESKGRKYKLEEAGNIKFLSLVDPEKNSTLTFEINYSDSEGKLKVSANAKLADTSVSFKIKGVFY
ncbi:3-hydroxyacyl-ACP dehydratase [Mangrovivirga sp. M17]|uniref:3-hydroxyacyl-ACP dehydratase n=1 Tax=Mangrovivirga halotolerans TaxID=2993936 RepID=A0ABT3RUB7_9BACT|nr:3-hydroxyacyl-ACP dehydratase [Mangrovivirga halotolerans]MCX2745373.1 3-hydroxyacyl-ACP dehydratase [Mangrovivirga halotolerans]